VQESKPTTRTTPVALFGFLLLQTHIIYHINPPLDRWGLTADHSAQATQAGALANNSNNKTILVLLLHLLLLHCTTGRPLSDGWTGRIMR